MRDLKGRTAIVTGAAGGIGAYVSRALAAEGLNLVLAALPGADLEALAAELGRDGRALAVPTDVADDAALAGLLAAAESAFGAVDVLVNNAGLEVTRAYHELPVEDIERTIAVNLTAPMVLTRLALPAMLARGRGHIVNMASLAGKGGPPFAGTYGPTKAGLITFTKSLRAEYRRRGVSASAICPGYVREVGMFQRIADEAGIAAPRLIGTAAPAAVARAVVRAIQRDLPEVIVNPGPVRLLTALSELSPALGEWVTRRSGADEPWRQAAAYYTRRSSR